MKDQPLVILHDHLDGFVPVKTLVGIYRASSVKLYEEFGYDKSKNDIQELESWVARMRSGSLSSFLSIFNKLILPAMQSRHVLKRMGEMYVQEMHKQGVIYAQPRFAPQLHLEKGLNNVKSAWNAICQGMISGMASCDNEIIVRPVLCAIRSIDATPLLDILTESPSKLTLPVYAVDFAGPEQVPLDHKNKDFVYDLINHHPNIDRILHALEIPPKATEIPRDVAQFKPHHIAHGTYFMDNHKVFGYMRDHKCHVQVTPTSNLITGAIGSYEECHIADLREYGISFSISPDDQMICGVSARDEINICFKEKIITESEVRSTQYEAAMGASCSIEDRSWIIKKLRDYDDMNSK